MIDNHQYNSEKNYVSLEQKDQLISFLQQEKGLDFSEYSEASVRRRISKILSDLKFKNTAEYLSYLSSEESALEDFVERFTVNVTEMFRDPFFFQHLIKEVLPKLASREKIRIWSAGCSSGEEVLSLAIILKENGLLDKTHILGTDLSDSMIERAEDRAYRIRHIEGYLRAYKDAGGRASLEKYYSRDGDLAIFSDDLYRNVTFAKHNLVENDYQGQFDLIVCRNVLIYFNSNLQNKVIHKLYGCLVDQGYLALGSKESVIFYSARQGFEEIISESKIYQKV